MPFLPTFLPNFLGFAGDTPAVAGPPRPPTKGSFTDLDTTSSMGRVATSSSMVDRKTSATMKLVSTSATFYAE